VLRAAWRPAVVWVLPAAALAAIVLLGLHWSRAYVAASPKYRVASVRITWEGQVTPWWEEASREDVDAACAAVNGLDMLDPSLVDTIAESLGRSPWVREVRSVTKRFPHQVDVSIVPRRPAAAVRLKTRRGLTYHVVGEDAVRLPVTYATWRPPGLHVPYITGTGGPLPEPGEAWGEPSVAAAIEIARLLRSSGRIRRAVHVTEVDVSNYGGRRDRTKSEFLVHAENDCVIRWGRAPGTDKPGELPVAEKIAKFERYLAEQNPTSNRTLDLRFAGRMVVDRRFHWDGHSG
jgi:hypothetical protein